MKSFAIFPFLALAALTATAAQPVSVVVETINERELTPRSAFELRFPEAMVGEDAVGKPGDSPLAIQPALKGTWIWLSSQSGVYSLSEPPPLGASFQITTKGDLKTAAGKAFSGSLKETYTTPPFRVKGWSMVDYWSTDDATATPKLLLCFPADVDPATVAGKLRFTNADKAVVDAKAEAIDLNKVGSPYFPEGSVDDRTRLTWSEAFREHRTTGGVKKPKKQAESDDEEDEPDPTANRGASKNMLVVTSGKPLPPGKGWKLVVDAGLPAAAGGYKLAEPFTVEVGEVKSFSVESVEAHNLVYSGKRVQVKFSKALGKAVRKEPAKFVNVAPAVANLKVEVPGTIYDEYNELLITGDFDLGKDYTVSVAGEAAAREPITLGKAFTKAVSFAPIPSRLYFQEFSTHQQRAGSRVFNLMGVNVRNVRVTAKVVPAASATKALDAWAKYYKEEGPDSDEWLQKLDEKTVPGAAAWQKDFAITGKVDEKKLIALNWDDILGAGKTGTVLLTAEQSDKAAPNVKRAGTQALVQVTDLGLVWKDSGDFFFHAFSLTSAQPVAGATIRLLDETGKSVAEAKVAADGTARIPKPAEDGVAAKWMVVTAPGDQLALSFDNREALEFGRFRINVWGDEEDIVSEEFSESGKQRGLLFSDRPVYRPGELVHLKGIVRDYTPGKPHVPAGAKATLSVKGPRGRMVLEQEVTLTDAGSFTADVQLPRDIVGYFRAALLFSEEEDAEWASIGVGFSAQEYEPNAYEVKVAVPKTPMLGGEITLPISAKYYMGQTLSKAQVAWNVRSSDERFMPEGFEDYVFTNGIWDWRLQEKLGGEARFSAQDKTDLAEGGVASAKFTIPGNEKLPQPRQVKFIAEVTDINQQTVAERAEFLAHSSDFYLGVRKLPDVVHEGDALPLQVIAVRTDGTPEPQPVEATVKITRIDWQTNRVEEADEADNFRSEPQYVLVSESPVTTAKVAQKGSKWLAEEPGKATHTAGKPGLYIIAATAKDAGGRPISTTTTFYVYGKEQMAWNYRNKFQIELVPDKPEYRPGEIATVLVKTPIGGPALVTIERENVRRHFFTKLEGNAPVIKVPLQDLDAPNVFVSVMVLRGSQDSPKKFKGPEYRMGYTQLSIKRPDAKLYVNLKPVKDSVRPGEKVGVTCEVRDMDGKPVAGAEVTVWAADEGILSLTGFETPDPLAYFSKLLRLNVTTGLTLEHLLEEDPAERAFENKGYLVGGFGKGGDAAVRRNFLGTAYWNATLKTGADGKLTTEFAAPDGLTRYRLMAVAQTKRDQFGHAESAFEINKPLMLEPVPPRFANVGDKMVARALIHNTTGKKGEAVVRVKFDPTVKAELSEQKVALPESGAVSVDFPVEFIEPGEAVWTWSAEFADAGEKDSVETRFKVGWPTPLLREIRQAKTDADAELLAGVDPALLQGRGTVRVSIANSRIFELREGVSELLHYPYGCVEQTTSAMLPWLGLKEFKNVLPEINKTDEQFGIAVEKSIARLFTMQVGNGGLAYWPGGDAADFWGSAYGAMGLVMAQKAEFTVPENDLNRLLDYIAKELRGAAETDDQWQLSPRAFACYVLALAGRPEAAYHETLYGKRDKLTQESRAFLALAIAESNGPAKMADTLLKMKDKAAEPDYWFGNLARAQAIRLMAWSRLAPKSDGTTAIADALFDLRRNGSWQTTQGNVWAVLSLADYIKRTEVGRKEVKGSIAAGGQSTAFQLAAKGAYVEKEYPFDAVPTLKLLNPGKGRLYTQVTVEARPKTLVTERKDRGYAIGRTYQKINDDGSLAALGEPKVGDRVLITLDFTAPVEARYLVIDDALPATLEAVNPEFKSQAMANAGLSNTWTSDYNEIRTDRALFFKNNIWPGRHQIRYLARVRATGIATAPPTKIEEMYQPSRFGLAESILVQAAALK